MKCPFFLGWDFLFYHHPLVKIPQFCQVSEERLAEVMVPVDLKWGHVKVDLTGEGILPAGRIKSYVGIEMTSNQSRGCY